jgi:hypothetical protein
MGRDLLVGNVTQQSSPIDTFTLTNGSQFSGSSGFKGFVYHTSVTYVAGYADNTSIGINHNGSVPVNGANAIDGLVAVFTVTITTTPANATYEPPSPLHLEMTKGLLGSRRAQRVLHALRVERHLRLRSSPCSRLSCEVARATLF